MNTYTPSSDKIVHETHVDFNSKQIGPVIHIRQYDASLPVVKVKLYKNGVPYVLPEGTEANVRFGLGNGSMVYNPVLGCNADRTVLYFEISSAMTPLSGTKQAVIEVVNNYVEIASSSLISIEIDRNPVQESDVEATGEAKTIVAYVGEVKQAADNAATSETNAALSAQNAATSETNAANSASNASTSASNAASSAANASISAGNASASATLAGDKAIESSGYADISSEKATAAANSAINSNNYALESKSYAVGTNGIVRADDDTDNAEYYYERAKSIAESLGSPISPQGTVAFEDLPPLSQVGTNWMYNISNEFTTTSDFVEGAGNVMPAGTNIYKVSTGKWDCFAGNPVTGVKGSAESTYRKGNVNITAANIGLANATQVVDKTRAQYNAMSTADKNKNIIYRITDEDPIIFMYKQGVMGGGVGGAGIDDTTIATDKTWSSKKTSDEIELAGTYSSEVEGYVPIDTPLRDADTLGGHDPSYFAQASNVPTISIVDDTTEVDPPLIDADYLDGKPSSEYATIDNIPNIETFDPEFKINCTVNTMACMKYGKLVIVNMRIVTKQSLEATTTITLASGFPKPKTTTGNFIPFSITYQGGTAQNIGLLMSTGLLQIFPYGTIGANGFLIINFVYVADE